MSRDAKEISPEKDQIEVEAFPTEARMIQKEKGNITSYSQEKSPSPRADRKTLS